MTLLQITAADWTIPSLPEGVGSAQRGRVRCMFGKTYLAVVVFIIQLIYLHKQKRQNDKDGQRFFVSFRFV